MSELLSSVLWRRGAFVWMDIVCFRGDVTKAGGGTRDGKVCFLVRWLFKGRNGRGKG